MVPARITTDAPAATSCGQHHKGSGMSDNALTDWPWVFGEDHPQTKVVRGNLAAAFRLDSCIRHP